LAMGAPPLFERQLVNWAFHLRGESRLESLRNRLHEKRIALS
jgi:hypothetical protein